MMCRCVRGSSNYREASILDHITATATQDPMAGTGVTLRVAQRLGRRFLGIEQQAKFVELVQRRLQAAYQQALFRTG